MNKKLILGTVCALATVAAPVAAVAHDRGDDHGRKGPKAPVANAGTVESFTGGVLTLALADGSKIAAKVTDETEVKCKPPAPTTTTTARAARHGADDRGDHNGDGHRDNGDRGKHRGQRTRPCSTADLTAGAVVRKAEIDVTAAGAIFDEVKLVK